MAVEGEVEGEARPPIRDVDSDDAFAVSLFSAMPLADLPLFRLSTNSACSAPVPAPYPSGGLWLPGPCAQGPLYLGPSGFPSRPLASGLRASCGLGVSPGFFGLGWVRGGPIRLGRTLRLPETAFNCLK